MAKFVSTEDKLFTQLCKQYTHFSIPNFQRPYAWKNNEIQEFWDSLTSNTKEYFLGNLVTVTPDSDESPLIIVDGQQRLTTIFLVLSALRDIYKELETKLAPKGITDDLEEVKDAVTKINNWLFYNDAYDQKHIRLTLGKESYQEVFNAILSGKAKTVNAKTLNKQQLRYLTNYQSFIKIIEEYVASSELARLAELKEKILALQFVTIVLESEVEIYNIFEGFNNTGIGLSPTDLIKNSILKCTYSDAEIQKQTEFVWREMEIQFEETEPTRFTRFLRYDWMIKNGYVSGGDLFRVTKPIVEAMKPKEILIYVQNLFNNSKAYLGII